MDFKNQVSLWLACAILFLITLMLLVRLKSKGQRQYFQGPFAFPIVGNLPQLLIYTMRNQMLGHLALLEMSKDYGHVMLLRIGNQTMVHVQGYECIKECLQRVVGRTGTKAILTKSYGKQIGVAMADGAIWRETRNLASRWTQNYGFGESCKRQVIIQDEYDKMMNKVRTQLKEHNGIVPNFFELMQILTMSIAWNLSTGCEFEKTDPRFMELIHSHEEWLRLANYVSILDGFPLLTKCMPWVTGMEAIENEGSKCLRLLESVVNDFRKTGSYMTNPGNFIETFLFEIEKSKTKNNDNSSKLDEEMLVTVLSDIFLGGAETTAAALSLLIRHFISKPEIQQKIVNEIEEAIGFETWPTVDDILRLPYTEATILECHRHTCVVPCFNRRALEDVTLANGIFIPKDTVTLLNVHSVHSDKIFWGDPEAFRPERFLNESGNGILKERKERIFAFGSGKRICFGHALAKQMIFVMTARMVQQFHFEMDPKNTVTHLGFRPGSTAVPTTFNIKITQRQTDLLS